MQKNNNEVNNKNNHTINKIVEYLDKITNRLDNSNEFKECTDDLQSIKENWDDNNDNFFITEKEEII